jgi:2'-hydroxyisoflavone reductase
MPIHPSRREFLSISLAGAAAAMGAPALAGSRQPSGQKGLNILILGGTGFIGPEQVEAARARGHTVTLFNRGRREKAKGGMFPDVEKLYGNRDPEKFADDPEPTGPKGLESLKGRQWDVVIDNSGYVPRITRASAELLAPNVKQYIFISTVSVYASHDTPGADEDAPLGTMADPTVETMGASFENYGPLKALCEQSIEAALPGRTTIIRPGYIVGPNDPTDRFTYWPVRLDRGGEVLVPGMPEDPVQVIDARDLGAWAILMAERGTTGIFNAVGPGQRLPMKGMIDECRKATSAASTLTWVDSKFLEGLPPAQQASFPIWTPSEGEYAGFGLRSNARAVAAGLTFRPTAETARDTLAWFKTLPAERQAALKAGPSAEAEAAILASWHESQKK